MRLVLLGPPGAGKGTQARMLASVIGAPQVATGDLLRAAVRERSAIGLKAQDHMKRGTLVPDELVLSLVAERLAARDARRGFILDGFPRSVAQAEAMERLTEAQGWQIDRVVALDVPEDEIVGRISGRRTCPDCGAVCHVKFDPPRTSGRCDNCGGHLVQREDAEERTIRKRLQVYRTSTRPLLDYYERRGLLERVDGTGTPEEVSRRLLKALGRHSCASRGPRSSDSGEDGGR